jgi:acyl dehydratase
VAVDYRALATGKYFEELEVGKTYKHAITRTVGEVDNMMWSAFTYNCAWLHTDEEYCKQTEFGQRLVNSNFTFALVNGVGVQEMTLGTTIANLGFTDVKFPSPVFFGDTIYTETEVISKRDSRSRPDAGLVEFEVRGLNQRDQLVISLRRTGLMIKKSSLPPLPTS